MMYASNKNTQGVGYGYGGFRDSVDMGILWGFHGDFRMDSELRRNELNTAHFFVI